MRPGVLISDRFEIDRLVGEGGMGVVYRATDRASGEPVALKLTLAAGDQRERDERFDREIRLLAALDHPRIARYVGHGIAPDGRAFLAMQWLEGQDLAATLVKGPLSQADSLNVLGAAADAMAAVHGQGVVHRDLKPSNLFLRGGSTSDVVLLDFGVSRRRDSSALLTGNSVVGTPHYMAPEQVSSAREILPAADVFSMGCVFYECLTGRRPFDAGQLFGVLARILYDQPEPAQAIDPSIPDAWADLLRRMLDKQPEARPPDGAALVRELAALPRPDSTAAGIRRTSPVASERPRSDDQVLVCAVLATAPDATLGTRFDALRSAMHRFGCPLERLPDGSLLATVLPRASATDLVHIAARWAIYLRDQIPGARIAVATGRASLGPSLRFGEAVDRAAQLLERAPAGEIILLDAVTSELLDGRFATGSREGFHLLLGQKPDFDDSRPLLGKPTPCVGRDLELIQLEGVMASVVEEAVPKAAVVLAGAGIGKSRLRHELLRRLSQRHPDSVVLVGYGDPLSAGSPYVLLAAALRRRAGIRVGDDPATARARICDELGRKVEPQQRQRVMEFMGELAGVPFPAEDSPPLRAARGDHRVMSEQIALAFTDWLAAECAAHPVILVLEDLQWGDALTVKLLESALRDIERGQLFVLALARPEVEELFPRLLGEHRALSLTLRTLSPRACELLVKGVLGDDIAPAHLERLVLLAAGNALFLEELIRAAAEGKAGEVPDTVVAMLQARLSRLQPEARRVLRAASVLGETFWRGGVARICSVWHASDESDAWLAQLVAGELIARQRTSRFPTDVEYTFRHALVRDAAAGLLTDADRSSAHRAAGVWLEEMGESDGIVLARHAEEGGDHERASAGYARAAEQSIEQYDFAEALSRAGKGMALGASGPALGVLRAVKTSALFSLGWWNDAADAGLSALDQVPPAGALWCSIVEVLLQVLPNVGQWERGLELSDQLLLVDPEPEARAPYLRAVALRLFGYALTAAHERGQACLDFMDRLGVPESDMVARGYAKLYRAIFIFISGNDLQTALELTQQAAGDLAESQVMYRLSLAQTVEAFVCWGLGNHFRSERAARQAQATAREIHDDYHAALAAWYLGLTLAEMAGPAQLDEAERCAGEMLLLDRGATFVASARVITALCALGRRDWPRAEADARAAREGLDGIPAFCFMASAYLMAALGQQGRRSEAAALAREDLPRLARIGGPLCSEVMFLVAAAEALFNDGARDAAESALREALRQIELRAAKIADDDLRASYLTGREENRRAEQRATDWFLAMAGP